MTQYSTSNIKLSNSQLDKLKPGIQKGTQVTLNLSSNVVGESNDDTNVPHKLLLTHMQVSKIHKAFANGSSTNTKFSKTQLSKMIQLGGFLSRLLGPLIGSLPLIEINFKPLAKSILVSLGLTAALSATDATIHKKILGSGTATLIFSNKDLNDIMKIGKSLNFSDLLTKEVSVTAKNDVKGQKGGFLVS